MDETTLVIGFIIVLLAIFYNLKMDRPTLQNNIVLGNGLKLDREVSEKIKNPTNLGFVKPEQRLLKIFSSVSSGAKVKLEGVCQRYIFNKNTIDKTFEERLTDIMRKLINTISAIAKNEYYIKQIENVYGLLYLVGNHGSIPQTKRQVSPNLVLTRYTLTTGSYIISEKAMDLVLENIKGYPREIDVFYIEHIQQKLPCFFIHPHLAGQVSSYSGIAQRDVNYNL